MGSEFECSVFEPPLCFLPFEYLTSLLFRSWTWWSCVTTRVLWHVLQPNFSEYFNQVSLFEKNLLLSELFVFEPMTNFPKVFASTQNPILMFWSNMTNTCGSKANLLELFVFLTIYGSKSNNYSTLMHKTRILLCLQFDLGYRGLLFASTTNLQAEPRFADIWLQHMFYDFRTKSFKLTR